MKKLLLIISLLLPMLFSHVNISSASEVLNNINEDCDNETSIVRIVDNYNVFKGNGIVYKKDDNYNYIIVSSKVLSSVNSYGIIYENNVYKKANILGNNNDYEISILKTDKVNDVNGACFANSNYLHKGQNGYIKGYISSETKIIRKTNLIQIGELTFNNEYKNIFKNIIQTKGDNILNGIGVFDELNRLIGVVNDYNKDMKGTSYMIESNKLIKIADSIVKTGNYELNYIKYNIVDYASLSHTLKESYGVSDKVDYGVVITTFKPLKYIFGGLNQGMTIVAVNGVEIKNIYELDRQLVRYEKDDSVCLKVIKKNGKEAFYYVEV